MLVHLYALPQLVLWPFYVKKRNLRWHLGICLFISPNKLNCLKSLAKTLFSQRNDSPPYCLVTLQQPQLRQPVTGCWRLWGYLCKSAFYMISNALLHVWQGDRRPAWTLQRPEWFKGVQWLLTWQWRWWMEKMMRFTVLHTPVTCSIYVFLTSLSNCCFRVTFTMCAERVCILHSMAVQD